MVANKISAKEKSATFAGHFAKIFQPDPSEITVEEENEKYIYLDALIQLWLPIKAIKICEVAAMIKTILDPKKAPGYDLLSSY